MTPNDDTTAALRTPLARPPHVQALVDPVRVPRVSVHRLSRLLPGIGRPEPTAEAAGAAPGLAR
jgi:hypothetical protein